MPAARARLALLGSIIALALSALACQTIYNLIELEGPEDRATDAVGAAPFTPTAPSPATTAPPAAATRTQAAPATNTPTTQAAPATAAPPATTVAVPPAAEVWPMSLDDVRRAEAAMRAEFADHLERVPQASHYLLDLSLTFDAARSATLEGRMQIRYINPYDWDLYEIYLMLWPNLPDEYLGSLTLHEVRLDGEPAVPELEHGGIAARLNLAQPLPPGQPLELEAAFTTVARAGLEGGARFGLTYGNLVAPTFYPIIPRVAEGQWQIEPPPRGGDTTNSDTSFYAYRLSAPADMQVVASGSLIGHAAEGDRQTLVYVTGPMRDLALVAGRMQHTSQMVDGLTINVYTLSQHARYAPDLLAQAVQQVAIMQSLVGPYTHAELDIVDAPGAYGGIEYPGLILIGAVGPGDFMERANVHEVGHMWFYHLIGSDQLLEPWLDEGAASYTEVLYDEHTYGRVAADQSLDLFDRYQRAASDPSLPIGWPMGDYPSTNDYYFIVYGKGALFFHELRAELGDETFFQFLQSYYDTYLYGFADSRGFQAVAEQTCGCSLQTLFDEWVYLGPAAGPQGALGR
jgi:hypothetical protein